MLKYSLMFCYIFGHERTNIQSHAAEIFCHALRKYSATRFQIIAASFVITHYEVLKLFVHVPLKYSVTCCLNIQRHIAALSTAQPFPCNNQPRAAKTFTQVLLKCSTTFLLNTIVVQLKLEYLAMCSWNISPLAAEIFGNAAEISSQVQLIYFTMCSWDILPCAAKIFCYVKPKYLVMCSWWNIRHVKLKYLAICSWNILPCAAEIFSNEQLEFLAMCSWNI